MISFVMLNGRMRKPRLTLTTGRPHRPRQDSVQDRHPHGGRRPVGALRR
jgi:hypothetical protein